eukprot:6625564-Prorocentrum_lima.AAC.1
MDKVKARDKVMLVDKLVNSNIHKQTKELRCPQQVLKDNHAPRGRASVHVPSHATSRVHIEASNPHGRE